MKRLFLPLAPLIAVLFFATACGEMERTAGSARPTRPPSVQVTETDFHIASSVTSFSPGQAYHFIVSNRGKTAHEFMIMPRDESAMAGMPMDKMDSMALARLGKVNPGETRTFDYTFLASATNSHPEFVCYLPGHYEAGMKLDVVVTAERA